MSLDKTAVTPLISVVLPAFNCAPYLYQAIDSILNQSLANFELLVIYDASSDGTLQIIESFVQKDSRVHLIEGRKARLVGALNQGIELAKGKFIARMDADDVSLPLRFAKQVELLELKELDFCGCDIAMVDQAGNFLQTIMMPNSAELIASTLACTVPFAHGSVMMRADFLDRHQLRYQAGASAEDYEFWCNAFRLGARFGNVNEVLFYYRDFSQSLSKVQAQVVHQHTKALRRKFVRDNTKAIESALMNLAPIQKQLSVRDEGFLVLAAYLLYRHNQSASALTILKNARLRNLVIAIAKILRGF